MPTIVDLPEKGVSLEFPDGMSDLDIESAILKEYPDAGPKGDSTPPLPNSKKALLKEKQRMLESGVNAEKPDLTFTEQIAADVYRGVRNLQQVGYGLGALGADLLGAEGVKESALRGYQKTGEAAELIPGAIGSYKNIQDIGDVGQYAVEKLSENLAMMLPSLVTGGIGAMAGKEIGKRAAAKVIEDMVAKGVAREVAETAAAKALAKNMIAGSLAGAYPSAAGLEAGSIYGDVREKTGKEAPLTALGLGMAAGSLDILPSTLLLKRAAGPVVANQVVERLVKRLGKAAAEQLLEAPTEAAQTAIERLAVQLQDPNQRAFSPEGIDEMIDSALSATSASTPLGVGGGLLEHRRALRANQALIPQTISAIDQTPGAPPVIAQVDERVSKVRQVISDVVGENADVDVYFDPNEIIVTPDGKRIAVPSKFENGRVKVNAAFANDEALLRGDVLEEFGHKAISTPEGQQLLTQFLTDNPLTDAQISDLKKAGYLPDANESLEGYNRRIHDEFIAKQGREEMGWFRDMADRLVVAVKKTFGIDLTHEQAARSILRELRKGESKGAANQSELGTGPLRPGAAPLDETIVPPPNTVVNTPPVYTEGTAATTFGPDMLPVGGDPQVRHSLREAQYQPADIISDMDSWAIVNRRLAAELETTERLLGLKGEDAGYNVHDVINRKGEGIRVMLPQDLSDMVFKNLDRFKELMDAPTLADAAVKNGLLSPEQSENMRTLFGDESELKMPDVKKINAALAKEGLPELEEKQVHGLVDLYVLRNDTSPLLGDNGKVGASTNLALLTCNPTEGCSECYAARQMSRPDQARKAIHDTVLLYMNPEEYGRRVAEEAKRYKKSELPFIRLHGSGEMNSMEHVRAFNEMAKTADRPIHVFSRRHDLLGELRGTANAPFIKMGSIDGQLSDAYGIDFLKKNLKERGIANAYLYSDPSDLPKMQALADADALDLILAAKHELHDALPPELKMRSCPCDAGERSFLASCRQCAMSKEGCFMAFADKGMDSNGTIWNLIDVDRPDNVKPMTAFVPTQDGVKAWQAIARDILNESRNKIVKAKIGNLTKFMADQQSNVRLADLRRSDSLIYGLKQDANGKWMVTAEVGTKDYGKNPSEVVGTFDTRAKAKAFVKSKAESYIKFLNELIDKSKKGTFWTAGGPVSKGFLQQGVAYRGGSRVTSKEAIGVKSEEIGAFKAGGSVRYSLREDENKPAPVSAEQAARTAPPAEPTVSGAVDSAVPAAESAPAISEPTTQTKNPQTSVTGLKHAISDEERIRYELNARPATERQEMEVEWEKAGETFKRNPIAGISLADALIDNPTHMALTSQDSALLLRYKVELEKQLNDAADRLFKATDSWEQATAKYDYETVKSRLDTILTAVEKRGTEWGREGRWRQALAAMDYSFTAQERKMAAARGRAFDPNIPEDAAELANLQKLVDEHKAKAEKWEEAYKKAQAESLKAGEEAAMLRVKAEAAEKGMPAPHIMELLKKVRDSIKSDADESRAYFKAKNNLRTGSAPGRQSLRELGLSDDELHHLTRIAADNFMAAGEDFAKWSGMMEQDLGDFAKIAKSEFQNIFERGKKYSGETASKIGGKSKKQVAKAAQQVKSAAPTVDLAKVVAGLKEAQAEGLEPGELGRYLKPIIKSVVEAGEMEHEAIFDKTGEILRGEGVEMSKDEIRQAFSDYGKSEPAPTERVRVRMAQLRSEAQKILGLKTVLEKGTPPLATGPRRVKASDLYRRTVQQINDAMKRLGVSARNAEGQLASALDARKTYRRNRIKDLRYEISTGQRIKKGRPVPLTDTELEALNKEYVELKRQHAEVFPKQPLTDEHRLQIELKHLDMEIEKLESDIKSGKVLPKEKPKRLQTPELNQKRARLQALRDQRNELRGLDEEFAAKKAAQALENKKQSLYKRIDEKKAQIASGEFEKTQTPVDRPAHPELESLYQELDKLNDEIDKLRRPAKSKRDWNASQAVIRQASKMIADLEDRMARGDFSKRPKKPAPELNAAAQKAKEDLAQVRLRFKQMEMDYQQANRGPFAKVLDFLAGWKRTAVLAWPTILGKLTTAAAHGMWIATVEDTLAGGVGQMLPEAVRSKAVRYRGGTSVAIEIKAYVDMLSKLIENYKSVMKTGEMPIDLKYGTREIMVPEFLAWIGHMHYALKSPLVQYEWKKSYEILMRNAEADGSDIMNPGVQFAKGQQALRYAHERIFSEPNRFTSMFRQAIRAMERPSRATGEPSHFGMLGKAAIRFEMPVVSIPTNIVKRAFEYAFGGWAGSYRLARAFMKGIDKLAAEEADLIIRNFARGALGFAFQLYGWFCHQDVGGYYHEGEKKKPSDPKFGTLRIGGVDVPKIVLHHPLIEQIQIGATAHRVFNKMLKDKADYFSAATGGMAAALAGLVEEAPFAGQIKREVEGLANPSKFFGEAIRSTVPGFIQWIAGRMDTDTGDPVFGDPVKRKPKTLVEHVEMGIPGMREQVPMKK